MFEVQPDEDFRRYQKYLDEFPKRMAKVLQYSAWAMADWARRRVQARLPKQREFKPYSAALKVFRVNSSADEPVYSMVLDDPGVDGRRERRKRLYHFEERANAPYNIYWRRIQILIDYSPWPEDDLPFVPDMRYVNMWVQKASGIQWHLAKQRLRRQRPGLRVRMRRAGLREPKREGPFSALGSQAYEYEFGKGNNAKPVWSLAVRELLKTQKGLSAIMMTPQGKKMMQTLTDPKYGRWTSAINPPSTRVISLGRAKKYNSFMDKLGVKRGTGT